ncbi:MAG: hypothetical protein Hals2KO_28500 [Halioglobus sp.]
MLTGVIAQRYVPNACIDDYFRIYVDDIGNPIRFALQSRNPRRFQGTLGNGCPARRPNAGH